MRAAEFTINIPINIKINGDGDPEISVNQTATTADDTTDTMIPPLQQKIELLKKSAGVKSVYDHEAGEDEPLDV